MTMLKGIPRILPPDLLRMLAEMGHGDELVLADANFPSHEVAHRIIHADAADVPQMLEAILQLMPLDSFVDEPAFVMQFVDDANGRAPIWDTYQTLLDVAEGRHIQIGTIERFAFYERARTTYGVVVTGETALYANLILKKGVIFPD